MSELKKYYVLFEVHASTTVEVEAENEEQARELAYDIVGHITVCCQCSGKLDVGEVGEILEVGEA